jgi:hypothetical protein
MLMSRYLSRRSVRADHVGNARWTQLLDLTISLLLALSVALATVAFYRWAYHPVALAQDRIKSLFQGFYGIEGEQFERYRWTNGRGTYACLRQGTGAQHWFCSLPCLATLTS